MQERSKDSPPAYRSLIAVESSALEEKVPRRGGSGTGGMKESGKEHLKSTIYESTRASIFIKGDARRLKDRSQMSPSLLV